MKTLRTALTAAALLLLCAGYAASQVAYFLGRFAEYSAKVDTPPIQHLALAFLLAAVVLALIQKGEGCMTGSHLVDHSSHQFGPHLVALKAPSHSSEEHFSAEAQRSAERPGNRRTTDSRAVGARPNDQENVD